MQNYFIDYATASQKVTIRVNARNLDHAAELATYVENWPLCLKPHYHVMTAVVRGKHYFERKELSNEELFYNEIED